MKPSILFFMAATIFACNPPQKLTNANDAKFIFRATVERVGAATLPEISDAANCIVVKVNEVISAPVDFTDWTNRSVTVAVKDINKLKPETEWVFYTNGWLYGKSLAVIELERINSREINSKKVLEAVNNNQDKKIKERLRSSEMVVSGQIIKIDTLANQKIESEHDPEWAIAEIRVDSLLKGKMQSRTILFRFPTSRDVMWKDSPRFSIGQKGIWLLRREADKQDIFTITEKDDYYPIERLGFINSLLK